MNQNFDNLAFLLFDIQIWIWIWIGHVHVLLYVVKFKGEIDIVQFIFTRCVVYSFEQKLSLHKKDEK